MEKQRPQKPGSRPVADATGSKPKLVALNRGLVAKNMGKRFKKRPVVRGVSLQIQRGEVVGLLGPNGAGKTTCFYIITGLIEERVVLTYSQFTALPQVRVFSDVHCVTGWSKLNNTWDGVSSQTIYDLAKVNSEAKYVLVKSEGGFTANLTLEDFLEEDVLFATGHDDQPLTPEHGGPVRLVVPRLYFWKSAKWATGLEFSDEDRPGFWELAGYHNHGDPWLEERY